MVLTFSDWNTWATDSGKSGVIDWGNLRGTPRLLVAEAIRQALVERLQAIPEFGYDALLAFYSGGSMPSSWGNVDPWKWIVEPVQPGADPLAAQRWWSLVNVTWWLSNLYACDVSGSGDWTTYSSAGYVVADPLAHNLFYDHIYIPSLLLDRLGIAAPHFGFDIVTALELKSVLDSMSVVKRTGGVDPTAAAAKRPYLAVSSLWTPPGGTSHLKHYADATRQFTLENGYWETIEPSEYDVYLASVAGWSGYPSEPGNPVTGAFRRGSLWRFGATPFQRDARMYANLYGSWPEYPGASGRTEVDRALATAAAIELSIGDHSDVLPTVVPDEGNGSRLCWSPMTDMADCFVIEDFRIPGGFTMLTR
jgi:hypothetical protein